MLTSTFFSDIGFELMSMLALVSNIDEELLHTINDTELSDSDKSPPSRIVVLLSMLIWGFIQ